MDVCIYEPRHGFEAQLLKDLLAEQGIDAELQGAYLPGAMGELPALGLLQLRVPEAQAEPARALIARWQTGEFSLPEADLG